MEFEAKRDDGLVHTFNVTTQILIPSYCGKTDCHYKDTSGKPEPCDSRCEECDDIAGNRRSTKSLIGSIVRNIKQFKDNFDYEARDCPFQNRHKVYKHGCDHPDNPKTECNCDHCPLE